MVAALLRESCSRSGRVEVGSRSGACMNRPFTIRAAAIAALVFVTACSSGGTKDPCAPSEIPAGLGCEFWPTVTANAVDGDFAFGIALVNSGSTAAAVHVEGGAVGTGFDVTVPAGTSAHRTLPWVDALKGCTTTGAACTSATGSSVLASSGAYHVTSDRPIAAYQFSPALGSFDPVSADATALPGSHALGTSHIVTAWTAIDAGGASFPGTVAVTATADATTVQLTPTVAVVAGDLPALVGGTTSSVTLDRGDVLELLASAGDLTGTRIDSDKPVQVVGGHFCARVPAGVSYCDHLEEVIPPLSALGTSYVLRPPTLPPTASITVRVIATADGTALSYAPAVPGAPGTLASAGQFADIRLNEPLLITSTAPVLVAQYMEGGGGVSGDPSLAIAAPAARWRTTYTLEIPAAPGGGTVDVIAPAGAAVWLDGEPLWFGGPDATGHVFTAVGLSGTHRFDGDLPFTVSAYGLGSDWSYWYAPAFAP